MLHVTNGDSAAALIHSSDIGGTVLAWQDVLHIGPVPSGISMDALSRKRAKFLASLGWGDEKNITRDFVLRNATLQSHTAAHDQTVLWFEHDLYDQLQLIQILAWLAEIRSGPHEYFLICIDKYPGVESFRGLGDLNRQQMSHLFGTRKPVTQKQFSFATEAWNSFTNPNPDQHQALADTVSSELPFLQVAYRRFLEEWPSVHNGLSKTEEHALNLIARGIHDPVELLHAHWENEVAPFMGDWVFWEVLLGLARGSPPLIHIEGSQTVKDFHSTQLSITLEGATILRGEEDAIRLRGIDRWYGGCHVVASAKTSRWNATERRLADPDS